MTDAILISDDLVLYPIRTINPFPPHSKSQPSKFISFAFFWSHYCRLSKTCRVRKCLKKFCCRRHLKFDVWYFEAIFADFPKNVELENSFVVGEIVLWELCKATVWGWRWQPASFPCLANTKSFSPIKRRNDDNAL